MITHLMIVNACDAFFGDRWHIDQAGKMLLALQAIAPMIRNDALETLASRAEDMAGWEDINTRDPQALMQALSRQDMAYEIAEVARAMKTTQTA